MTWPHSISGIRSSGNADADFGDVPAEAHAALHDTVLAPLSDRALIAATGPDTVAFLQGQLSNDVRKLTPEQAQLSSFNSPKGRMLAVLHLHRDPDAVYLELPSALLEPVLKRLRMYVLRAKTVLADASAARPSIGIAGAQAASQLQRAGLTVPAEPLQSAWTGTTCVIRRRDAGRQLRYTVHAADTAISGLWDALANAARPVGTRAWRLLEIEAGIPAVHPQTSDRFVAQMCNLDTLGGISFDKGCYTGQEIIARVHYRGAVKRRMQLVSLPDSSAVPGDRLDTPAGADVVDIAPVAGGGARALVVAPD